MIWKSLSKLFPKINILSNIKRDMYHFKGCGEAIKKQPDNSTPQKISCTGGNILPNSIKFHLFSKNYPETNSFNLVSGH